MQRSQSPSHTARGGNLRSDELRATIGIIRGEKPAPRKTNVDLAARTFDVEEGDNLRSWDDEMADVASKRYQPATAESEDEDDDDDASGVGGEVDEPSERPIGRVEELLKTQTLDDDPSEVEIPAAFDATREAERRISRAGIGKRELEFMSRIALDAIASHLDIREGENLPRAMTRVVAQTAAEQDIMIRGIVDGHQSDRHRLDVLEKELSAIREQNRLLKVQLAVYQREVTDTQSKSQTIIDKSLEYLGELRTLRQEQYDRASSVDSAKGRAGREVTDISDLLAQATTALKAPALAPPAPAFAPKQTKRFH
jgi:hypothetical protein